MNRDIYQKFARVLVEVGVNLQPGERAVIQALPEHMELVREIAVVCYQKGASYVRTDYIDEQMNKIKAVHCKTRYLKDYPNWLWDYHRGYGEDSCCVICLHSPRLFSMDDIQGECIRRVEETEKSGREGFVQATSTGKVSIVKSAVPSLGWAKLVYPQLRREEALERLWDSYLAICRLNEADPVYAWRQHQKAIEKRKEQLKELKLEALLLTGPGISLKIGLIPEGSWIGGCAINQRTHTKYLPNIPSEEIFTVPHKYRVNGTVTSTMPLNFRGHLIEGISLAIKDGKVIHHSARKGEPLLTEILNTDEGSRYFGEIALVSVQSPIYQTHTTFYDTLLDENATCHMAFGNGSAGVVKNGYELSAKEREIKGINTSDIHVDFMIGSSDLDVEGIRGNGERIWVMHRGDWSI